MKRKVTWEIGDKNFEQITYTETELGAVNKVLGKLRDKGILEEYFVEEIK